MTHLGFPRIAPEIPAPPESVSVLTTLGDDLSETPTPPDFSRPAETGVGAGPAGGERGGSFGTGSTKPPKRPSQPLKRSRFVTYVAQGETTGNPPEPEQSAGRRKIELAGMACVQVHETEAGRVVRIMPVNHPGYDLEAGDSNGIVFRDIEVKSLAGAWGSDGIGLTSTEFSKAQELGERYWLYVVEFADTDEAKIHRIPNPAGKANRFYFDCGWIGIRES